MIEKPIDIAPVPEGAPTEYSTINMGPSHPAMHGTVRIRLTLDGEVVKDADIEAELRPLFTRWKEARTAGERFGDFAARVLWPETAAAAAAVAEPGIRDS